MNTHIIEDVMDQVTAGLPKFYVNPHKNYPYWYKGAVHVHSNISDGSQTPMEVLRAHKSKGYHFVFLTDHNKISPQDVGTVDGILCFRHFPSFEDGQKNSHHILVLGIDYNRVASYHRTYPDVDPDANGTYGSGALSGATGWCSHVRGRINYYSNIALAVLAHPHGEHHNYGLGFGWVKAELLDTLNNFKGIEIFNSSETGIKAWYEGVFEDTGRMKEPFCIDWWDAVLHQGRLVWGFGADDCHSVYRNGKSFNRAWIVVNSERAFEDSREMELDILRNIREGNFYTVIRSPETRDRVWSPGPQDRGPKLEITCAYDQIRVRTDKPSIIKFYVGKSSGRMHIYNGESSRGDLVTETSFRASATDKFVRIVVDQMRPGIKYGEPYRIYSQPLFVIHPQPGPS